MPFSLSGDIAGGAYEGLQSVLDRRLKEAVRQQQEKEHADNFSIQQRQLAMQEATRRDALAQRAEDLKFRQSEQDDRRAVAVAQDADPNADLSDPDADALLKSPITAGRVATRKVIDARPIAGTLPLDTSGPQSFRRITATPEQAKAQYKTVQLQRIGEALRNAGNQGDRQKVGADAIAAGLAKDIPQDAFGATEAEKQKTALEAQLAAEKRGEERWGRQHAQEVRDRPPSTVGQVPSVYLVNKAGEHRLVSPTDASTMIASGDWGQQKTEARPVTANTAKEMFEINQAMRLGKGLHFNQKETGFMPWLTGSLPDWATSLTGFGVESKQRQGLINISKQIIAKGMEGGVLRKEDEEKYKTMIPGLGDHPDVAKSKINDLMDAMQSGWEEKLNTLEDSGYDVSKYRARGPSGGVLSGGGDYEWDPVKGALVRK